MPRKKNQVETSDVAHDDDASVLAVLRKSPVCMSADAVADALGWELRRAGITLSYLADSGQIEESKIGRARIYWHPDRPFYPDSGITGPVHVAHAELSQKEILERASLNLKSALFILEVETIKAHELVHLPLWRVEVTGQFPEGLIFKKTRKRSGTLYFHAARGHLCSMVPEKGLIFGAFGGEAPDSVQDLDDFCQWDEVHPGDLRCNPALMARIMPAERVQESLTKRWKLKVNDLEICFLPCFKITITDDRDPDESRTLILDAVKGLPVQL